MDKYSDEYFMNIALIEARKAYQEDEVPVGAVLVIDNKIIAKAHNKKEASKNAVNHAEVEVIKKASKKLNAYIFDNATLYVTLEPCLMCSGLILQSHLKRVVFAAKEPKFGSFGSILNVNDYKFNHHVELKSGILEEESSKLLKDFFKEKRMK